MKICIIHTHARSREPSWTSETDFREESSHIASKYIINPCKICVRQSREKNVNASRHIYLL